MNRFSLHGKKGIVTGASRGLGLGMAAGLVEAGASIVIAARNGERLEENARSLAADGSSVIPCQVDVAVDNDLDRLVDLTLASFGSIDFLFCNAGIVYRDSSEIHSVDKFDQVMRVNVRSVFLLAQKCASVMIEQGRGGSIVLTESVVTEHGSRAVPGYSASKGALHSLMHTLANDWGKYGIRVNGIAPGFCDTDMTEGVKNAPERYDYLTSRMALGRWGTPDDFAGPAVFLASDASSYVTGTTLFVDGGFLSM